MGGRFNSEFGMEGYPHISTIKAFISDESEMHAQSLTMDFHNKANFHERRLATYVHENFRVSSADFKVSRNATFGNQNVTGFIVLGLPDATSPIRGYALCLHQVATRMGDGW